MSDKNEVGMTKKLSHGLSRTESRILGALSKLDEFFLNPQSRIHSGPVSEAFQNSNWKTGNEWGPLTEWSSSQSVCPSEPVITTSQPKRDALHGGRNSRSIACSFPGICSVKQKKGRSTSQPQFRSGNTPPAIETDQIFLPFNSWRVMAA